MVSNRPETASGASGSIGIDASWYHQLFESNPVPMWIYDLETLRFLDVNEVACQKYGYTRDEFLSMTIRDIRPPEDIRAVEQSVRFTPAEVFNSGVWRHLLRDGRLIYVEITSHELVFAGRLARFVAPLDVTKRVLGEAALLEWEAGLRRVQELARLSDMVTRADGSFESWSDTLPALVGCSAASLPRSNEAWMTQLVQEEDRDRFAHAVATAMQTGVKVEVEYRLVRPNGEALQVAQVIDPIERGADGVGEARWFSTLQDVTAQKVAETTVRSINEDLEQRVAQRTAELVVTNRELVAATRAAENANRAKSEFLTRMSHELRTPLNAIIGFAQLLSAPGHRYTAEKLVEYATHILTAGQHLLTLINDLLNLASIEAGKVHFDLKQFPLRPLITECAAMVTTQAESRGLATSFAAPPDALIVQADRTRLKQVMLNLLSNAIKYNRRGGEVSLEVRVIDQQCVRIEVRDTGEGLSDQQLAQLYEPFNRLGRNKDVLNPIEGTGLGLVVSKHLIEQMGDRIGVTSTPGAGSCFWVDVPVAVDDPAASGLPGSPVPL